MTRRPAPALAFLVALAACNRDFEPQYRVTDLRILAVRSTVQGSTTEQGSTAADPTPDDTVVLELLLANPTGRAPVEVRWYACLPSGTDAVLPCVDDAVLADPDRIPTAPGIVELPVSSGTGESIRVDLRVIPQEVVAAAFRAKVALAQEQPTFRCLVFLELPVIAIVRADGKRDVVLKRVRIAPRAGDVPTSLADVRYRPNLNPQIVAVLRGDTAADGCTGTEISQGSFPVGRTRLCGQAKPDGDRGLLCDASGSPAPSDESYSWQWYVTAGEFPDEAGVGNATDADPEFDRPAGAFTLWAIVRDGRGGVDWLPPIVVPAP